MKLNNFCKFMPQVTQHKPVEPKRLNKKSFVNIENAIPNQPPVVKKPVNSTNQQIQINENTNIFAIDAIIKSRLNSDENLSELEERKAKLTWIMENTEDDLERLDAKNEIFKIDREICLVKGGKRLEKYIEQTFKILEKYKSLGSTKKSFVCTGEDSDGNSREFKKQLADQFLIIARSFIPINHFNSGLKRLSCSICNSTDFEIIEDNFYACKNCQGCTQLLDDSHSYKDIDRLNLLPRFSYTKEGHFKEAIQKFQGLQNTNIEKTVYDTVETEMKRHSITKETLTLENVLLFLQENGFNKYYDDAILIHSRITGAECPNISQYAAKLVEMNEMVEKVFEQIKSPDRINALHVHYKLLKLLGILGFKCERSYFNILKTKEKIDTCDEYWEQICDILDWPFESTTFV